MSRNEPFNLTCGECFPNPPLMGGVPNWMLEVLGVEALKLVKSHIWGPQHIARQRTKEPHCPTRYNIRHKPHVKHSRN